MLCGSRLQGTVWSRRMDIWTVQFFFHKHRPEDACPGAHTSASGTYTQDLELGDTGHLCSGFLRAAAGCLEQRD